MSEISQQILESLKTNKRYMYSQDATVKILEIQAINDLESMGYIDIKIRTIGYVIAEIL